MSEPFVMMNMKLNHRSNVLNIMLCLGLYWMSSVGCQGGDAPKEARSDTSKHVPEVKNTVVFSLGKGRLASSLQIPG
jgi:hypothetical protein